MVGSSKTFAENHRCAKCLKEVERKVQYKCRGRIWHPNCFPKEMLPDPSSPHQRLKDAVVEAAKADMLSEIRQEGDNGIDRMIAARRAYRAAVHALLEFESSQQKQ